ncbi:MAG: tRNA uridine(34) 5-carboxymethylaminomethyl modification radical SAM/GNAT enzyme Elp3 [archaeon]
MKEKDYSLEIINAINEGRIASPEQLNKFKLKLAKKFALSSLPSNPTILSYARHRNKKLLELLSIKPVRSLSGIAVVSIMPKPFKCPGECIYCPSGWKGIQTPKSYTGKEPATMRALSNEFDAEKQIHNRIEQLETIGKSTEKIELIVMGGTFPASPLSHQKKFMLECFNAVNRKKTSSLEKAKKMAETSRNRLIGITFETRPDYCRKKEINRMLSFGGTRVELGVQNIDDFIYKKINRGHTVKDVIESTSLLKDSAFKVAYHLMPGLPFSNKKKDLKMFKEIFSNPSFKPDMLKIYPCLVIEGTKLHDKWKKKEFTPLSTKKAAELIAEAKTFFPKWMRVMRIQRDIPSTIVSAGVKHTNLRQLVKEKTREKGIKCNCIRCREIGHKKINPSKLKEPRILVEEYEASNGHEFFISMEDVKNDLLYGFCRLRIPFKPFRKEISPRSALIRELHVYSQALPLGKKPSSLEFQHRGFGRRLLEKAEELSKEEFNYNKLTVISGIGAKPYYRALNYYNDGFYLSKSL